MKVDQFIARFRTHFETEGFSFVDGGVTGPVVPRVPPAQQLWTFGYERGATDEALSALASELVELADLISFRLTSGAPVLVLAFSGDGMTDEAIIGHFVLFERFAPKLKKFSLTYSGGLKRQVWLNVFVIFETTKCACHFHLNVQQLCLRTQFWNKIYVRPWGIDLESRRVYRAKTLLPESADFWSAEKLEQQLF